MWEYICENTKKFKILILEEMYLKQPKLKLDLNI